VDIPAVVFVFFPIILCSFLAERELGKRLEAIAKYSCQLSLLTLFASTSLLLQSWSDSTVIGPVMSFGLLSLLYGILLFLFSQSVYFALYGRKIPNSALITAVFLLETIALSLLCFVPLLLWEH